MRATRRALAACAPALLLLPLVPGTAAAGHVQVRGTTIACPPGEVSSSAESGFTDIGGNTFETQINCLSDYGIAKGTTSTTYSPAGTVLRRQMALFLYRVGTMAGVGFDTRDAGFTDLGGLDEATREAVNALANAQIAKGSDGRFNPGGTVTRGQMASFLDRLEGVVNGTGYGADRDYFDDDAGSTHEGAINALARAGIANGTSDRTFEPARDVSRAQMAGFLARALDVLVERGDVRSAYADEGVMPTQPAEKTAVANPDTSTADDQRYTARGLAPGEEYRVTLVLADNVTEASGAVRFARDAASGLVDAGPRTADITTVDGEPAKDNTGDGTPLADVDPVSAGTAVLVAGSDGVATFVVDGDQGGESVRPVLHRNGGPDNEPSDGGTSAGLEVDEDGAPVEPVALGGLLTLVEEGIPTVTDRPELVSTGVVRTRTDPGPTAASQDDRQLTEVRYVFDERVTGKAPVANRFHLVGSDSAVRYDGTRAVLEPNGTTVLVTFGAPPNPALPQGQDVGQAQLLSIALATVDMDAVRDASGLENPVGDDGPLVAARSTSTGTTAAPDLIRVLRTAAAEDGTTVTLEFDEPAFPVGSNGFHVITLNGVDLTCTAPAASGATLDVLCPEDPAGGPLALERIARAYVDAGAVSDTRQDAAPGADGATNPLQATGSPHRDTPAAELLAAEVVPALTTGAEDQVVYVFDLPVTVRDDSPSSSGDPDGPNGLLDWRVYTATGGAGTTPTSLKAQGERVTATFPRGTAAGIVGVSVEESAVLTGTSGLARLNEEDETSNLTGVSVGATDGPDLVQVVPSGGGADFVFDEDVAADHAADAPESSPADETAIAERELLLGLADGTTLVCHSAEKAGANTVRCSQFKVSIPGTDVQTGEDLVPAAVIGWVDDGAVRDTETPANHAPESVVLVGSAGA